MFYSYPYLGGLPTSDYTTTNTNDLLHNGKEFSSFSGLYMYDNEARNRDPLFNRFTSIDPMAEKYPDFSPYAVCGNNPLIIIDPSGKYWEKPGEAEELEDNLSEGALKMKKRRAILEELEKNGGLSDAQRSELNDVIGQIDYLNKAIDAIHQLGNDPNMFFFDQKGEGSDSYVYKGNNRHVGIAKTSDATAVHEIIHISQFLNAGGLVFNKDNILYNAGLFMSNDPMEQLQKCAENEREAYKAQYAADSSPNKDTLPAFLGKDGLKGITIEKIGNLHNGRGFQYPYINKYKLK